jgi:hypothetical protein
MYEKVYELVRQQPFKPFQVRLTNGKSITIRNPKNVMMLKSRIVVAFPKADRFDFFDVPEIAAIDLLQPTRRKK